MGTSLALNLRPNSPSCTLQVHTTGYMGAQRSAKELRTYCRGASPLSQILVCIMLTTLETFSSLALFFFTLLGIREITLFVINSSLFPQIIRFAVAPHRAHATEQLGCNGQP